MTLVYGLGRALKATVKFLVGLWLTIVCIKFALLFGALVLSALGVI